MILGVSQIARVAENSGVSRAMLSRMRPSHFDGMPTHRARRTPDHFIFQQGNRLSASWHPMLGHRHVPARPNAQPTWGDRLLPPAVQLGEV